MAEKSKLQLGATFSATSTVHGDSQYPTQFGRALRVRDHDGAGTVRFRPDDGTIIAQGPNGETFFELNIKAIDFGIHVNWDQWPRGSQTGKRKSSDDDKEGNALAPTDTANVRPTKKARTMEGAVSSPAPPKRVRAKKAEAEAVQQEASVQVGETVKKPKRVKTPEQLAKEKERRKERAAQKRLEKEAAAAAAARVPAPTNPDEESIGGDEMFADDA